MSPVPLHLWLRGEHLGEIEAQRNGRPALRYDGDAIARYGIGARPLSLSMPIGSRRIEGPVVDRFLDGLLPEGQVRAQLDTEYGTRTALELLGRIGSECAGAVQFTTGTEPAGPGRLTPLTDAEVDELVTALPSLSPPAGEALTASLGGIQAKLLLARIEHGWAWPSQGALSTHIIKPQANELIGVQHLVHAEHWAISVGGARGRRDRGARIRRSPRHRREAVRPRGWRTHAPGGLHSGARPRIDREVRGSACAQAATASDR